MKKTFRFALMAVLTVGISLAATSCKDDDNSENGGGEPMAEEIAVEHAETFWSVAANLVSPFDVTTDYENKTFEPTIGSPLDGSSTIRVVNCGSMASAASRFTSITGVEIDENTATYTYQDDAVGTLVYTKTDNATSLATIDVNIKQIPHLQQIVFKTSEQMGTNGKFSGTAYYSFGDVISLDNEDGLQEYWVCIRPALGPAGKEDTHWATLNSLPKKNVWNYHGKKKDIEFNLPMQLGEDFDQMQNLAELLYAVCNPNQWWENLQQNSGVNLFGDLYHERAQYFNQYFWQIVQKFWSDTSAGPSLSEKLFGYEFEDMKKIINDQNALHLLYKGFSWWTTSSNSPTLYEYTFSNGTGKELFGSQPGVFQSMKGGKRNIRDVYVLNEQLGIKTQSDLKVFTEDDTVDPDEGYEHGLYQPGDVLQDQMGNKWMCIFGAACNTNLGFTDRTAWFVSFDGIQQGNIVKEKDLIEMAHRFTFGVFHSMTQRSDDAYCFKGAGQLGQWQTAYDYAGIDMSKMWVNRDSTWTFTANGKTFDSKSDKNLMTNIVYVGDDGKLKLLRCIADNTQSGSERTSAVGPSGKAYDTPMVKLYKHYETFDPSQMEQLNEDEKALNMTMWQKPWAITNVEMHFEDLSNQDKVNKYAANDKWVTLPLNGTTERQKPKTSANNSMYGRAQYEYNTKTKDFYTPGLTGIFKEPVLIMRLMKVTDNGGTTPNLTAQDGTKLTVVKLVKNPYLYNNNLVPMINYMLRNNYQQSLIFLDNKPYQSDYKF